MQGLKEAGFFVSQGIQSRAESSSYAFVLFWCSGGTGYTISMYVGSVL